MKVNTNPEMNTKIADILSKSDQPMVLYAAARIRELEAEVDRLKQASEWRPIETAPKDGSNILVLNNDGKTYQAEWGAEFSRWYFATADQHGCGCCGGDYDEPTHWMPLPEPPDDWTI